MLIIMRSSTPNLSVVAELSIVKITSTLNVITTHSILWRVKRLSLIYKCMVNTHRHTYTCTCTHMHAHTKWYIQMRKRGV